MLPSIADVSSEKLTSQVSQFRKASGDSFGLSSEDDFLSDSLI